RFDTPRLKQRAEEKLKEINHAYDSLQASQEQPQVEPLCHSSGRKAQVPQAFSLWNPRTLGIALIAAVVLVGLMAVLFRAAWAMARVRAHQNKSLTLSNAASMETSPESLSQPGSARAAPVARKGKTGLPVHPPTGEME